MAAIFDLVRIDVRDLSSQFNSYSHISLSNSPGASAYVWRSNCSRTTQHKWLSDNVNLEYVCILFDFMLIIMSKARI